MPDESPLHEEVAAQMEALRGEARNAFVRGYEEGQKAQADADRFYARRSETLSRLLAEAETEITTLADRVEAVMQAQREQNQRIVDAEEQMRIMKMQYGEADE